jgi:hypothetical protein
MTPQTLFNDAVTFTTPYSHAHGLKAAAAVVHLSRAFPHWDAAFWQAALTRANWFLEDRVSVAMPVPELTQGAARAPRLLRACVLPTAYAAVRQWQAAVGTAKLLLTYLPEAVFEPGDLGHRLSVLLGHLSAADIAANDKSNQLDPLMHADRLTEFLLASQFKFTESPNFTLSASFAEALAHCLTRPTFFAHNLILLAWSHRYRALFSDAQWAHLMGWIVLQEAPLANAKIAITVFDLEQAVQTFMLQGQSNLHLLTLADAVVTLWPLCDQAQRQLALQLMQRLQ